MVEISLSGSGGGPGAVNARAYPTSHFVSCVRSSKHWLGPLARANTAPTKCADLKASCAIDVIDGAGKPWSVAPGPMPIS